MDATSPSPAPAVAAPLGTGTVLGDRYRIERHIATGGMGTVWEATDTVLDRAVAVKVLKPELVESGGFLARFRAEARHAALLGHPGIAGVFDYGEDVADGTTIAYLVMELVRGETLSDLLHRTPVPRLAVTLSVLRQCAEALGAAHRAGVVHRDVKPANIMLVDGCAVTMTDFGIARAVRSAPITDAGETVGTPRYMSPEQATGGAVTPAADVYSLGIIAHEMLSGRPPFERDHPAAVALAQLRDAPPPLPSCVPTGVADLVATALSKDPAQRPSDGDDMAARLRVLEQPAGAATTTVLPALTTPMPVLMPLGGRRRRRRPGGRLWLAAVVSVLLLIVGAAAVASRQQGREDGGVPAAVTTTVASTTLATATTAPATAAPATTVEPAVAAPAVDPGAAHDTKPAKEPGKGKGKQGG